MNDKITIRHGDCLDLLRSMPDNSIDAVVTDPPYGLSEITQQDTIDAVVAWASGQPYRPNKKGFMGKSWDGFVPGPEVWREVQRVLKPGGHALVFAGSRTQDLMGLSLRLAGFEIRDGVQWMYGSGFPKSLDVSKAIDKAAGAVREVVGSATGRTGAMAKANGGSAFSDDGYEWPGQYNLTAPTTDAARQWEGWGTALKPAYEPVILCRKPLIGTVAENVLAHGTGALNIESSRISAHDNTTKSWRGAGERCRDQYRTGTSGRTIPTDLGRFPANVIHDGSPEVMAAFADYTDGEEDSAARFFQFCPFDAADEPFLRFFYTAKAGADDRFGSRHPTVKPISLIRYLCRLITPPCGLVLDCFAGSGTTGAAALAEGFRAVLMERDADSIVDIRARIDYALGKSNMTKVQAKARRKRAADTVGPLFGDADA